ncbi:hypothetical protein Tco_0847806 [Tanacetum coccineum]
MVMASSSISFKLRQQPSTCFSKNKYCERPSKAEIRQKIICFLLVSLGKAKRKGILLSQGLTGIINKRTRMIVETIHVNFDELPQMASDHVSSDPGPQCSTTILLPLNIHSTHQTPTQVPTVIAPENIIQAETNTENAQFDDDEFINIFSTPVQEQGETSSRHVDSSNMHTFYQHHPSAQRWTKDHPLEQVIGNPSQSVRTRRQLETDGEMCMFALTVSRTEPKNIKEAMADSAWIESMQEELHQFDPIRFYRPRKLSMVRQTSTEKRCVDELSNFLPIPEASRSRSLLDTPLLSSLDNLQSFANHCGPLDQMNSHGLPAWHSCGLLECAFSESTSSAKSKITCASLPANMTFP